MTKSSDIWNECKQLEHSIDKLHKEIEEIIHKLPEHTTLFELTHKYPEYDNLINNIRLNIDKLNTRLLESLVKHYNALQKELDAIRKNRIARGDE